MQQRDEIFSEAREQEHERSTKQAEAFNARYTELLEKNRRLEERVARLQGVITKNASNDNEPLDTQVINAFCNLRQQIQSIVHRQYDNTPTQLKKTTNSDLFDKQKAFFRGEFFDSGVPQSTRQFGVRAKLYSLLHERILTAPCFGLDEDMERTLTDFENELVNVRRG